MRNLKLILIPILLLGCVSVLTPIGGRAFVEISNDPVYLVRE